MKICTLKDQLLKQWFEYNPKESKNWVSKYIFFKTKLKLYLLNNEFLKEESREVGNREQRKKNTKYLH